MHQPALLGSDLHPVLDMGRLDRPDQRVQPLHLDILTGLRAGDDHDRGHRVAGQLAAGLARPGGGPGLHHLDRYAELGLDRQLQPAAGAAAGVQLAGGLQQLPLGGSSACGSTVIPSQVASQSTMSSGVVARSR